MAKGGGGITVKAGAVRFHQGAGKARLLGQEAGKHKARRRHNRCYVYRGQGVVVSGC